MPDGNCLVGRGIFRYVNDMTRDFILAVATSTVCATLLNQLVVQWREYVARRETGQISALYAAVASERYCDLCSEWLSSKQQFNASNGALGDDMDHLPPLEEYPEQIDWKRLGLMFAEKMTALRVDVAVAQKLISFRNDFDPPDGGDHDLMEQLTIKGLIAVKLAREIRRAHRLTITAADREFSSEVHLATSAKQISELHERYVEAQKSSLAALQASQLS